jgi:predicted transcriptional regulator
MTPKGEIEMLQSLSQRGVAFLLGVTPRSVRNYADLPRNDDGSYDVREIIAWVRSKAKPTTSPLSVSELALLLREGSITDGVLTE